MEKIDYADKIIITNFTDPICTWCWGSEPVYRKIETHYPNIETRFIMGGLVKDIRDFSDPGNHIGGDGAAAANQQIMEHWLEASERHKMPVEKEGFALFSDDYPSTYPQNIAYKAAQKMDQTKAELLLRLIRESTAAKAMKTSHLDVLVELAGKVGLDKEEFERLMTDGTAKAAFRGDLYINQALGVTGYPTVEIKYNNEKVILRGFHPFEHFAQAITKISGGRVTPIKPEVSLNSLYKLMIKTPNLAIEEVRQAFDFTTTEETEEWLTQLETDGKIVKFPIGNGYMIKKA